MQIYSSIASLRAALKARHAIVFVPTMGNLHDGHLALINKAHAHGDTVVSSIFVNRLQFGAGEDFDCYPRTFTEDCQKLEEANTDFLFAPNEAELYPELQTYQVDPPAIQNELEGRVRPGHFRGVATVVLKLFNIVCPQTAIFGKKDYQQLIILRNMVRQLALPIEILAGETIRASDGLALSSRNAYLTPSERAEAPRLHRVLAAIRDAVCAGETDFEKLEREAMRELDQHGWQTDYVCLKTQSALAAPSNANEALVVLAAARLGIPRLIDNIEI